MRNKVRLPPPKAFHSVEVPLRVVWGGSALGLKNGVIGNNESFRSGACSSSTLCCLGVSSTSREISRKRSYAHCQEDGRRYGQRVYGACGGEMHPGEILNPNVRESEFTVGLGRTCGPSSDQLPRVSSSFFFPSTSSYRLLVVRHNSGRFESRGINSGRCKSIL